MPRTPVALAVLLAAAAVPGLARDTREPPAATPTGKPVGCINLAAIRESRVRNDQVIDFVTRGGAAYRNTLPQSCPSLGFERRFAYRTSLNQLCSVDIITVLQGPGAMPGASCGLGPFQPITLADRRR